MYLSFLDTLVKVSLRDRLIFSAKSCPILHKMFADSNWNGKWKCKWKWQWQWLSHRHRQCVPFSVRHLWAFSAELGCASFLLERMFPSNPNHNVNMCVETFDQTFASAVKRKQVWSWIVSHCLEVQKNNLQGCRYIYLSSDRPPCHTLTTRLNWVDFYRCHIYDIIGIGQY